MKAIKCLILASLVSITSVDYVHAATKNNKLHQTLAVHDNDSISSALSIEVTGREVAIDNNGQALALFKYAITNKSNQPISSIKWVGAYVNKRKVIYSQDMQINFKTPLMPSKSINLNIQTPFVQIDENVRPIFMNQQEKIDVYVIDRIIQFKDNKQLSER